MYRGCAVAQLQAMAANHNAAGTHRTDDSAQSKNMSMNCMT
jgi:hypothetical protein